MPVQSRKRVQSGVLVATITDRLLVLLPEQPERHAFLLQFLMHARVVGFGKDGLAGNSLSVEQLLQSRIVDFIGKRPAETSHVGQPQIFGDDAFGNLERTGNRLKTQPGAVPVSQYISNFAHG